MVAVAGLAGLVAVAGRLAATAAGDGDQAGTEVREAHPRYSPDLMQIAAVSTIASKVPRAIEHVSMTERALNRTELEAVDK